MKNIAKKVYIHKKFILIPILHKITLQVCNFNKFSDTMNLRQIYCCI